MQHNARCLNNVFVLKWLCLTNCLGKSRWSSDWRRRWRRQFLRNRQVFIMIHSLFGRYATLKLNLRALRPTAGYAQQWVSDSLFPWNLQVALWRRRWRK